MHQAELRRVAGRMAECTVMLVRRLQYARQCSALLCHFLSIIFHGAFFAQHCGSSLCLVYLLF